MQKLLREANFGDLADMFAAHPMGEMRQALYETGMFDSKGALVVEHNAVRYADEFMRKNFGDSEPWRGEYGNSRYATAPATVATMTVPVPLSLGCNQPAIDGFSAPPDDGVQAPQVRPQFARQMHNGECWTTSASPGRFPTAHIVTKESGQLNQPTKPTVIVTPPSVPER